MRQAEPRHCRKFGLSMYGCVIGAPAWIQIEHDKRRRGRAEERLGIQSKSYSCRALAVALNAWISGASVPKTKGAEAGKKGHGFCIAL